MSDFNILIVYSSSNGSTKRLAEGIYNNINFKSKTIVDVKDIKDIDIDKYDFICMGYWVDKAMPNKEALEFMTTIKNKPIFLFVTLGAFPESKHAYESVINGENTLCDSNIIYGTYICQGAVSQQIIDMFKQMGEKNSKHIVTPLKMLKYDIGKKHPSKNDIAVCSERVLERIQYHIKSLEEN